jgi:transposase
MPCYVGLDVSKSFTNVCVLDEKGRTKREDRLSTDPKSIIAYLRGDRLRYALIGIEAGPIASWLQRELSAARLPALCIEAGHAHKMLEGNLNKTDTNDARGIAELMRDGRYREVHTKSLEGRDSKALLSARRALLSKAGDLKRAIRGLMLGYGLKIERGAAVTFATRVRAALRRQAFLKSLIEPLLEVLAVAERQLATFLERLKTIAEADPVCRRLMTCPGVGLHTAMLFRNSIEDPHRFSRSRDVGAHFGLTSRVWQTGDTVWRGRITRHGDSEVRAALVIAARGMFEPRRKPNWLIAWARSIAARRGTGKAIVALARRLACVLHRMWIDQTDFRSQPQAS